MPTSESGRPSVKFTEGLAASEVHTGLERALVDLQRAEKNAVLWFAEILQRKLYRELGYSSIHMYAAEALGFSPSKTSQFIHLADSLDKLPALRESLAAGTISWTKARTVARVATSASQKTWVAEAKQCTRRELELKVNRVRDKSRRDRRRDPAQISLNREEATVVQTPAPPVSVSFKLDATQIARFDAILEKLRKKGCKQSREELLLEAFASLLDNEAAEKKPAGGEAPELGKFTRVNSSPHQIIISKCEKCGEAKVSTHRGELELSPAALARVECDAKVLRPGQRNRSAIGPARRRAVLARDGHRCRIKGCGNRGYLEVHHLEPRSCGGGNEPENLITVCSACHQLLHEKGLRLSQAVLPDYVDR